MDRKSGPVVTVAPAVAQERDDESTKVTTLSDTDPRLRRPDYPRNRAALLAIAGPHSGVLFPLDGEMVLGRGTEATVQITDVGISRRHAAVRRASDGAWEICDLNSTNGTFVDGQKVADRRLRDGDRIQIGRTTVLKFTIQDELEAMFQKELYDSAMRDPLTRAFNRRYFFERLRTELAYSARHRTPLSLVLLDVDFFKNINDTHGHLAGDAVLRVLAAALLKMIRTEDVFARIGGEEFGLLMRGTDEQAARVVAERARHNLAVLTVPWEDKTIRMTISAGIAHTQDGAGFDSPEQMYSVADTRLYRAKQEGRNRVVATG